MSSEALLSNVIPFAGSGLLGYAMGFALKRMFKWMLIVANYSSGNENLRLSILFFIIVMDSGSPVYERHQIHQSNRIYSSSMDPGLPPLHS
jgi:hypothetical protein